MTVLDADGHVTESQEQLAKYLEEPFRRRPSNFPFFPSDGWDRRLLGTLGEFAGDAEAWLRAMDKGSVETAVLYPTLARRRRSSPRTRGDSTSSSLGERQ